MTHRLRFLFALFAASTLPLLPAPAGAQVPSLMNNQGVLTTAGGAPVADGTWDLSFALYTGEAAATPVWTETVPGVAVEDGFYSAVLGAGTPLPDGLFRDHSDLWLGIRVGTGAELPRARLLTLAYAFEADHAVLATAAETAATASAALALDCAGCVAKTALAFDLDAAVATGAAAACYNTPAELRAVLDAVYLRKDAPIGTAMLPAGGLSAVSNGTLTNHLNRQYSGVGLPAGIGTTRDVSVAVGDAGTLLDLTVTLWVTHPFIGEVEVLLLAPGDAAGIRLVKPSGVPGGAIDETFSTLTPLPDGGTLAVLTGREQKGTWTVRVRDSVSNGNEGTGQVKTVTLATRYLASAQVAANADLAVAGDLSAAGTCACAAVTVGGTDLAAEFSALKAELWCVKNCDASKIGDCKSRVCDGTSQTCTPSGSLPDGTACSGGAGRCRTGACCMPATCYLLGAACGTTDDGCGGVLSCGACQDAKARCWNNKCCVPKTCADLGKQCGDWDDGCGGATGSCGTCGSNHECNAATGQCDCKTTCGGSCCPDLAGYTVTCNATQHCEYANADPAGWKQYDTWIYVPAGSFTMGSPSGESGHSSNEDPNHAVTFAKGFFIAKYEITVAQYEACKAASPGTCTAPSTADWDGAGWGTNSSGNGRSAHPQNGLTWDQAKAFCAWTGGRLPSEAEWEYAASGPVHRKYPWGNTPEPTCSNNTANFNPSGSYGCGSGGTVPAGTKTAGAAWSGALDMAGNLWEWCEDWWHGDYNGAPADGSAWVSPTGSLRVLRGGAFDSDAVHLRASGRDYATPSYRDAHLGARCLRPASL